MNTYIYILLGFVVTGLLLIVVSQFSKAKFFCKVFGWHWAPYDQGFDGCSKNGKCPRCGKSVMQDSQGNWF